MNEQKVILSTKKLTISQKGLLLNAGLSFVEYDAIRIELLKLDDIDITLQNAIFTSKNAVKAIANQNIKITSCFCVGSTTQKLLEDQGRKVIEVASSALELAEIIVKKYNAQSFTFFCGNLRRNELPSVLNINEIELTEKVVYHTSYNEKALHRNFDGILFFSPSAIQSYTKFNNLESSMAFCIGNTTASEAKKHTQHIIVANKPTVENVIVQAVTYFK